MDTQLANKSGFTNNIGNPDRRGDCDCDRVHLVTLLRRRVELRRNRSGSLRESPQSARWKNRKINTDRGTTIVRVGQAIVRVRYAVATWSH
jgi:hypothetical protein